MSTPLPSHPAAVLPRVCVVMVQTSHPGNIGSAARAMKTMGLTDLVLVTPRDPLATQDPQALALSSGATDILERARVVDSLATALADTTLALAFTSRRRELSHGSRPLREATVAANEHLLGSVDTRVALVFGNETSGLSNEEVDRCQMIVAIPANPEYASLNVSQAIQLAAYEMSMAVKAHSTPVDAERIASSVGEVEGFLTHLEKAAQDSGFLDPASPKRFMTRMRRLFTRARLEPEEVAILRGLLTAFQKGGHHSISKKEPFPGDGAGRPPFRAGGQGGGDV